MMCVATGGTGLCEGSIAALAAIFLNDFIIIIYISPLFLAYIYNSFNLLYYSFLFIILQII